MVITRVTPTADLHTSAIRAHGGTVARAATVLRAVARFGMMMIAATYALSEHRLGENHV